ncbi:MAG: peroxiredoxin [Mycoplasmatales bacterium]
MSEVKVGEKVESFEMEAVMADGTFGTVSLAENIQNKKWTVLFFYPMDFTGLCSNELLAMSESYAEFSANNAEVIGVSTDSKNAHKAWINMDVKAGGVGKLNYPLADDKNHIVSEQFGILAEEKGITLRGLYIIDDKGILQHSTINAINIGRNVEEIIRTLCALQTGEMCPVNWKKGDKTL